jgi:hypothetical protein
VTNIKLETEVEIQPEPDVGPKTDVHTDTEPKRAGNIGLHTKAVAGFGVLLGAESTTVAAGVLRTNSKNVGTVCAREKSSTRRKRIYNNTNKIDQVSL